MADLAENDLQRLALQRLLLRTRALRDGLTKLTEQLASRTELLRNTIDASQAEAIGAIDDLSVKMRQREQQGAGDVRPHAVPTSRAACCRSR